MKLKQEKVPFRPITLVLETAEEARAFAELIDPIGRPHDPKPEEVRALIREISNAMTNQLVEIPCPSAVRVPPPADE